MATLTIADDRLQEVDEFAKKEDLSRDELVDEAIRAYLNKKKLDEMEENRQHGNNGAKLSIRSKREIVESLFGIIPDNGMSLTELREERLSRYENYD